MRERPLWYWLVNGEIVPAPSDSLGFQDDAERMIARHVFHPRRGPEILVSTCFLCIDHAFGPGPPVLFETMIFAPGHEFDQKMWRYTSLADAKEGHTHAVALVKAALNDQKRSVDPMEQTVAEIEAHLNGRRD